MSTTAGGGFESHQPVAANGQDQFGELWSQALSDYTKKTKIDLSKHPLAKDLAVLDSPEEICDAFRERMKRYRRDGTKWGRIRNDYVKPIVDALLIINKTLGETAGSFSVVPGGRFLFVAFGAVLLATKGVSARYNALLDLLDEIKIFFGSLRLRTASPASWRNKLSRNIASLILVHILDAFALATNFIASTNRSCARLFHFGESLTGNKDMQEVLKRLRLLTTLESRAISSETHVDAAECRSIAQQLRQELGEMKMSQARDTLCLSIVERSVGDVLAKLILVANQVHETILTAEEKAEARDLLARLDRVGFADLSSQRRGGCLPGTRVEVLDALFSWSADANAPRIYWLNGMAGTGKSAIARSFAQRLRDNGSLGGSYFCSRESHAELADANRIVPTLSAALAGSDIQYKVALLSVLRKYSHEAHPSTWAIKLQIQRLFFEPFACYMREVSASPMPILVIDALDEANDDTVGDLLDSLVSVARRLPIKFFLTSRPERHIRWRLDSFRYGDCLRLHDVEKTIVTADIRLYIEHRLNVIVDRFRGRAEIPEGWPTRQDTESLVALSGSLFIYAFTTTEHIGDRNPVKRMQDVLNVRRRLWTVANPLNDLDRIYTFILNAATTGRTSEELLLTKRTLGAILAARELLGLPTLARLLGSTVDELRDALDGLHAVVNVPEDVGNGSVSTLHASFGDFLTDRERVQEPILFSVFEFSPSGAYIVVGTNGPAIYGWNLDSRELCLQCWPDSLGFGRYDRSNKITSLTFLSEKKIMCGTSMDAGLHILDIDAGLTGSHTKLRFSPRDDYNRPIASYTSSQYKDAFIATSIDGGIDLRNINTGDRVRPFLRGAVNCAVFVYISSDGESIISGPGKGNNDGLLPSDYDIDKSIVVWDIGPSSDRCKLAMNDGFDHFYLPTASSRGWMQAPNKELLLFIPEKYRQYLQHPPIIHRFAAGRLTIDWTDAVYGEDWTKCYIGPK
ncbi:unnamed protein product [Peniophora sp. CBMAI 1063]|nr:unnamed protein product [Peniophora sp. CBMAI 1063]